MADENIIYIGKKPTMNYVLACVTLFHNGQKEVVVKARGKAISKAVDVVQAVKNKFLQDLKIENVEIGTEEVEGEGKKLNVSTITITITIKQ